MNQVLLNLQKNDLKKVEKINDFIEGPCCVVDYVLSTCNSKGIAEFVDENFPGQEKGPPVVSQDKKSKFYITSLKDLGKSMERFTVYKCPRFGLSLKNVREGLKEFVMKPYRFLTRPQFTKKGKQHLILGLHYVNKASIDEIIQISKGTKGSIQGYLKDFESGKKKTVDSFLGSALKTKDISVLYGAWAAVYGSDS